MSCERFDLCQYLTDQAPGIHLDMVVVVITGQVSIKFNKSCDFLLHDTRLFYLSINLCDDKHFFF